MAVNQLHELEKKLQALQEKLRYLEVDVAEEIRVKRIEADMGDDFRENEGAKLVMEQHDMLFIRTHHLRVEILEVRKQIIRLKKR